MRAYPMRSGLVMDQNVIIGNLERVGNVWSARRLGDLRLKTPMVLWDPESRRAFAVDVFVSFSADNTRTIENLSVKPFEQPLASIGIVRTEVSTATPIPNPPGFAGAKLKLIAVEKVDGSYQGPEDANGRE
jgi:hypothetical protein